MDRYIWPVAGCGAWIVCFGVVVFGMGQREPPPPMPSSNPAQAADTCASCHAPIAQAYTQTAHFRTSSRGTPANVLGPVPAHVTTAVPTTRFRVERRSDGHHQLATWLAPEGRVERSERIDLVIGSGRRGQSYLYWRKGLLYQLPLSYFVSGDRWVNSPGYTDGEVHFDRLIPPRCLECHTTSFRLEGVPPDVTYGSDYELGIACQVCHGRSNANRQARATERHPAGAVVNPRSLTREQQIELCAVCHAGADREPRRPSFTFEPGDRLADHLGPASQPEEADPDVHGSQVALLASSRCFQESPAMTCSTCHDVHETERDVRRLSMHCLGCHAGHATHDGTAASRHAPIADRGATCVDCHMPLRPSRLIRIADGGRTLAPAYRTHRIAVYPPAEAADGGGRSGGRQ